MSQDNASELGSSSTTLGGVLAEAVVTEPASRSVRAALQRSGRVHISGALKMGAADALYGALQDVDWRLSLRGQTNVYDLSPTDIAALDPGQKTKLLAAAHAQAGAGFEFMFDSYRISDLCESGALRVGPLAQLFATLNSDPMLSALRTLTGDDRIVYLDAQATRFRPGHFLNFHDDDVEGKNRLFAYVINLTPVWRADWGGLLLFLDKDGHVAEGFTPRWNALNILKVPQPHAVSVVAPFAQGARFSITGWMRACRP